MALQAYDRVSSPAAVARHTQNLTALGVVTPCSSLSIDASQLAYLPFYAGVLEAHGRHRVVAADGQNGWLADGISTVLTGNLPQLRAHFTT